MNRVWVAHKRKLPTWVKSSNNYLFWCPIFSIIYASTIWYGILMIICMWIKWLQECAVTIRNVFCMILNYNATWDNKENDEWKTRKISENRRNSIMKTKLNRSQVLLVSFSVNGLDFCSLCCLLFYLHIYPWTIHNFPRVNL